jgi:serine/threonine protein kinase
MFRNMTLDAVMNLQAALETVYFAAGEQILRQGDEGHEMFLVDEGSVLVSVQGHMRDTHFERTLTAPAVIGEMALITATPRNATVTAESAVRCLRLSRDVLQELMRKHPRASEFLTRAVGERLLEASTIQHVGKYQVIGRLGAGAVATVFEGLNPELNRPVALKMLSHSLVSNQAFREQFTQEAQLIASLNHEHIVRVYDTETAYGTRFIVMEKLAGVTLDDVIQQGQRLSWGTIRRILREVASALAYSHGRGLLHRDVKPSNVFLTGDDRRVKLLDFGIAVTPDASEAKAGEQLFGTPYYMAPEQILGMQLDGRCDLYALGIMAYEAITGYVPFDADTVDDLLRKHLNTDLPDPRALAPDVPADLAEFVLRATQKRAKDRFASCDEAGQFLRVATELPLVRNFELASVAVSYHPSVRAEVERALAALQERLGQLEGVAVQVARADRPS